ncbi:MAG TPA: DivIVA domain-containing protein [Nocardioidaceae bacterium]|nr:DivIVA domain-containing protein [Nocardioidaceae bacterium]
MDASDSSAPARFSTVREAESYEIAEVDAFLSEVEAALAHYPPRITAEAVADKQFTPVRLQDGYAMGEVDDFLDHLAVQLRGRHAEIARRESATRRAMPAPHESREPIHTDASGAEGRRSSQPLWVRIAALVAIVALLALVVAGIF